MATLLAHTSDVVIQAEGYSLKELFSNGLRQMNEILLPEYCDNPRHSDCHMRFRIHDSDPTALLIDFLSEALALTYIHRAIFCHVYFDVLTQKDVGGNLFGRWYPELENEIKAVTYHEAALKRDANGKWTTPVLFDL